MDTGKENELQIEKQLFDHHIPVTWANKTNKIKRRFNHHIPVT